MGIISLDGIVIHPALGVDMEEQRLKREVILNVSIEADTQQASDEDSIEHAIDYRKIGDAARAAEGRTYRLLETLAQDILSQMQSDFPEAISMTVEVVKPRPILGIEAESASVMLMWPEE